MWCYSWKGWNKINILYKYDHTINICIKTHYIKYILLLLWIFNLSTLQCAAVTLYNLIACNRIAVACNKIACIQHIMNMRPIRFMSPIKMHQMCYFCCLIDPYMILLWSLPICRTHTCVFVSCTLCMATVPGLGKLSHESWPLLGGCVETNLILPSISIDYQIKSLQCYTVDI